jgi:hypothetical protein
MLAMYYIANLKILGEIKIIAYSNKFINNYMLGCKYTDQVEVNKLAPKIDENEIPLEFLKFFKNEIF